MSSAWRMEASNAASAVCRWIDADTFIIWSASLAALALVFGRMTKVFARKEFS